MISIHQALGRISGHSADGLRELCIRRLLAEDTLPVGDAYWDEPSEDLVIQLLRAEEQLPLAYRQVVVDGCKHVYGLLLQSLATSDRIEESEENLVIRICRVADASSAPELRGLAATFLMLVTQGAECSDRVRSAAVRAALSYPQHESMVPVWESLLEGDPLLASYAFVGLLSVNPRSPRVEWAIAKLWRRQLVDGWRIDTAFLTRRAARVSGDNGLALRSVSRVVEESQVAAGGTDLIARLRVELARRPWSSSWFPVEQSPRWASLGYPGGYAMASSGWVYLEGSFCGPDPHLISDKGLIGAGYYIEDKYINSGSARLSDSFRPSAMVSDFAYPHEATASGLSLRIMQNA